jgi:hypothetical protein
VAAALLVAGLWPFDVRWLQTPEGEARVRCGAALVEAWPEPGADVGSYRYVPQAAEVFLPPAVRGRLCGIEARERLVLPLYGVVGTLAVLAALSCAKRSSQPQES